MTITAINTKANATMSAKAQEIMFNMIMNNANAMHKDEEGKPIDAFYDIPVELLEIDSRYQGDRNHPKTNDLANNWDWRKYDMVTVVPHNETATFYVVDGQNRTNAARIKGIESLPCKIVFCDAKTRSERLRFEAELFVRQDEQIDKLRDIEKHKANLILNDKSATILQNELDKFHYGYIARQGKRSAGVIGSYTEGIRIAKRDGEDGLRFVFSILENAKWSLEPDGLSRVNMRALDKIYNLHEGKSVHKEIADFLTQFLKRSTPEVVLANAKTKYPLRAKEVALMIFLEDQIVEAGIVDRMIYPVNENKVKFVKESKKLA